jgi:hypothetical protein
MHDPEAPLPDMLGVAPPEHDVRGRILILLIHGIGAGVFGYALIAAALETYLLLDCILSVSLGALAWASMAYLADGVRRFRCWSWFFVMWWLVPPWLVVLLALMFEPLGEQTVPTIAGAMTSTGAVHYLWTRRWDFWADARLERRRPPPRAVTPEWRAARLAGIAAEAGRVRRTASDRPGALWMRRTSH